MTQVRDRYDGIRGTPRPDLGLRHLVGPLDRWLHLTPIGTIVGTLLGVTLSTLSVYREVMADSRKGPPPA